jgi:CheY-like chemotaxis protein/nitrogen-specific signal transduction histidine kinase
LRRIQRQVERTNADLRRKNDEIQNFYHTLSHELKTPLTSAREFIAIVRDGLAGALSDTQREYLGIALDSCNQLRVCINDLLDATRLETGKLSMDLRPGDLGVVVQRAVTALQPLAIDRGIELICDVEPELPLVMLDERRIAQVVANLLNNALKFTPASGCIQVRVAREEATDALEVSVADSGRGIPADQLERIFDRLFQVKSGDASTEQGIGLGLYICRELVRLHGGEIRVQSAPGQGSTFSFALPPGGTHLGRQRLSVLLVDDDASMREMLSRILEKAQMDVATAADGRAALLEIERRLPDVVVLDLEMPGIDGPATLREIRRNWGPIPVVLHTGHVDGPLLTRALECSPFTVLAKPCPMDQLLQTIRGVGRRTAPLLARAESISSLAEAETPLP